MEVYLPNQLFPVLALLMTYTATLLMGYILLIGQCPHRRLIAWGLALVGTAGVYYFVRAQPVGFIMIALIIQLLFGMKAVVATEAKDLRLTPWQWLAFATLWLGMRPHIFQKLIGKPLDGAERLMVKGAIRVLAGFILLLLANLLWRYQGMLLVPRVAIEVAVLGLLLPAFSLIVHFGFLNLMTGFWRYKGVPATILFNAPYKANTLTEFWGKRWNMAFAEMTAIAIFRPLRTQFGEGTARFGAFLFSGFAHEVAISVPVGTGYGLPTLYFLIQAVGINLERRWHMKGQLWTALWLLLPLPILFHTAFIAEIILPFILTQ